MEEIKKSSKKKKYIFVTLAIVIAAVSILTIIGALWKSSDNGPTPTGRDWAVSMLNPKNYNEITTDKRYYSFVDKYEKEIQKRADSQSQKEFDDLYDNGTNDKIWKDYNDLETSLTTTKLSVTVKTNVNWTKLLKKVNLSNSSIIKAQTDLLRFYNIISKLYNKDNILRLVQRADFEDINPNVFGFTQHFKRTLSDKQTYALQRMGFGAIFANQQVINKEYKNGYSATNALMSTPIHEYGHAVSFFLSCDSGTRKNFNTLNWPNKESKVNKLNLKIKPVSEYTQLLMNYLNTKAGITENDNIKTTLFPLITVRSNYGRSYWLEHNETKGDEYFAEAFDQWLETPKPQRTWNWELLNGFFMKELPKHFQTPKM